MEGRVGVGGGRGVKREPAISPFDPSWKKIKEKALSATFTSSEMGRTRENGKRRRRRRDKKESNVKEKKTRPSAVGNRSTESYWVLLGFYRVLCSITRF